MMLHLITICLDNQDILANNPRNDLSDKKSSFVLTTPFFNSLRTESFEQTKALVTACVVGQTDTNKVNNCTIKIDSFMKPVTSFMTMLNEIYLKTGTPFKIAVSDSEIIRRPPNSFPCPEYSEFLPDSSTPATCYTQKLLDTFKVYLNSTGGNTLLWVESRSTEEIEQTIEQTIERRFKDVCRCPVINKPCQTTTAPSTSTHCKTLRTIGTTTGGTTSAKTIGLTISTENVLPQSQNAEDMCAKSSDIVIASICSFVGGVVCSVALLLFLFRRHVCKRTETRKPKEEDIILNDDAVKAEAFVSKGSKSDPDKKTYETLISMESTKTDQEHLDHVYLGLDTRLREMSDVKHVDENTLLTNSNERSKQTQVKEQSNAAKEDHVYNVLKSEECANVYDDASDFHDHTYIGLNNRDTKDRNEEQGSSKEPEYNDRTSECHDYFVLADDAKGPLTNVTDKANEVQSCELHTINMTGVDPSSSDHAYFTLQKIEQSSSPTPDVQQKMKIVNRKMTLMDMHTILLKGYKC